MTTSTLSDPDCLREHSHLEIQRFRELSGLRPGVQDLPMHQHSFRKMLAGKVLSLNLMPLGSGLLIAAS